MTGLLVRLGPAVSLASLAALAALAGCANTVPQQPAGTPQQSPSITAAADLTALDRGIAYSKSAATMAKAVETFEPLAEAGNPKAQSLLGILLTTVPDPGIDGRYFVFYRPDRRAGIDWLRKAAAQGDVEAERQLGYLYLDGKYVGQDFAEAARWLKAAVERNDAGAEAQLADLYHHGRGVPADQAELLRLAIQAGEQGDAWALAQIGAAYANGQGLPKSGSAAMRWFAVASQRSDQPGTRSEYAGLSNKEMGLLPPAEAQAAMVEAASFVPGKGALASVTRDLGGTAAAAGNVQSGVGVVISRDGNLLTTSHLVNRCRSLTAKLADGTPVPATIVVQDLANDLAVVRAALSVARPVQFRDAGPRLGEDAMLVEFASGQSGAPASGTVSALADEKGDTSYLQMTVLSQGTHPTGILYDREAALLGVVTEKVKGSRTLDAALREDEAIKASVIRLFLDTKNIAYETAGAKTAGAPNPAASVRSATVEISCLN